MTTLGATRRSTRAATATAAVLLGALLVSCGSTSSADAPVTAGRDATVRSAVFKDVSEPFAVLAAEAPSPADPDLDAADPDGAGERPTEQGGDPDAQQPEREKMLPHPRSGAADPVIQRAFKRPTAAVGSTRLAPTAGVGFDTVGSGFAGFSVRYAPPDTSSAVGPTQIVTVVNTALSVQSKTGTILLGPVATSSIWSGFGGYCQSTNDGDGVVRYDALANRWIISQFANVASGTGPFYECVAVSTSGDATGTYNRYAFSFSSFPDYPKLSVWPDAYYVTYNMFNAAGTAFLGGQVCAMDRAAMLAGTAATQVCFSTSTSYGGLLASDLDGTTAPPTGAPNVIVALGNTNTSLAYWNMKVDFATPANSTLTGPKSLTVASYSPACGGGSCIPQSGTTNVLDSLADRLMNRLVYRNFGDRRAILATHAVTAGSSVGVRWYELRVASDNVTASVYQQGTFAPDSSYRWMSSGAFDKVGNIAIGYSLSSSTRFPSIAYSGRLVGDTLGSLTQGETIAQAGGGSQTGTLRRWGDYATMSIDPSDDCTFWFSTEYLKASGSFNWSTRISSFTLPNCLTPVTYDFSLALSPTSGNLVPSGSVQTTVTSATSVGTAQSVSLSASGLPAGATATFSQPTLSTDGSSTLTISTTASTPAGTYPITITGTSAGGTRTTTYNLTVSDFSLSVSPTSITIPVGGTATVTVASITTGVAQSVTLSALGLPTGVTASFNPATITSGSSSVLTLTAAADAPLATTSATVSGAGTALTRTAALSVTVAASVPLSGPITNPGFETGTLTGWTIAGPAEAVVNTARSGAWANRGGSTLPTKGDSSISQTFVAPTGSTTLSFWYSMTCPDTVRYDWAIATLRDVTANKTTTILPKTCTNGKGWVQVSTSIVAGRTYTLTLTSHDDNNRADPSFTLFDDVAVTSTVSPVRTN